MRVFTSIYFFKFPLVDSLGGAEFHTLKLAKRFAKSGRMVKLITSDRFLFRLFEKNRLPRRRMFIGFEPASKWALGLWPLTYLIARRKLKKLLKELPAGSVFFMQSLIEKLVLTHLALSTPSPSPPYQGGEKGRIIWLEHKIPGRWLKLNPLKFRYLQLARQVQLVTVSQFAKQEFVKLGVPEEKIEVVYPTPSSSPPIRRRRTGGEREGVFTLGLLSRLDPEKGVYGFLQTLVPHLPDHPDWKILIAGEGEEKDKIIKIIEKYNLRQQIQLLGFVNNLDEFFSQVSVLVYPSRTPESFGITVLEALGRGIPVVASNIGALPEIIEHGKTGFLVEASATAWIQCLESLEHPKLYKRLSQNATLSSQKFSEKEELDQFENFIQYS